jgi:hypothetical protein
MSNGTSSIRRAPFDLHLGTPPEVHPEARPFMKARDPCGTPLSARNSQNLEKLVRYAPGEQFSVLGENVICIVLSVSPVFVIKDALPESDCAL